jgi:hypothetical protein
MSLFSQVAFDYNVMIGHFLYEAALLSQKAERYLDTDTMKNLSCDSANYVAITITTYYTPR